MDRERIYEIWTSKKLKNGEQIAGVQTINKYKTIR